MIWVKTWNFFRFNASLSEFNSTWPKIIGRTTIWTTQRNMSHQGKQKQQISQAVTGALRTHPHSQPHQMTRCGSIELQWSSKSLMNHVKIVLGGSASRVGWYAACFPNLVTENDLREQRLLGLRKSKDQRGCVWKKSEKLVFGNGSIRSWTRLFRRTPQWISSTPVLDMSPKLTKQRSVCNYQTSSKYLTVDWEISVSSTNTRTGSCCY